ncbi:MAG: hypothetical protein AAB401_07760, partial [Acidobacteriota bacterium]
QLIELVEQLIAENSQLRAEIEILRRNNARSAASFSKNNPKKNPQRPGRKAGQGQFSNRPAPTEDQYTEPVEDVPVTQGALTQAAIRRGIVTKKSAK